MGEFTDLMRMGFTESLSNVGTPVSRNGKTVIGEITSINESKLRDEFANLPEADCVLELLSSDVETLCLPTDRKAYGLEVVISGRTLRIVGVDFDTSDPCTRYVLKAHR